MDILAGILLMSSLSLTYAKDDCKMAIEYLPNFHPLYINTTTKTIFTPYKKTGNIILKKGSSMNVTCLGEGNSLKYEKTNWPITQKLTCKDGQTFIKEDDSAEIDIMSVSCQNNLPRIEVRDLKKKCQLSTNDNYGTIFYVKLKGIYRDFLQYTVCFNPTSKQTAHVTHALDETNAVYQTDVSHQIFHQGAWFRNAMDLESLYEMRNQNKILKEIESSGIDTYLVCGQFAPRHDFVLTQQQLTTFSFLNCAPQWATVRYNWRLLERNLREYVSKKSITVDVTTGTIGTLILNNKTICLDKDCKYPVPQLFYKSIVQNKMVNGKKESQRILDTFYLLNNPIATSDETAKIVKRICKMNTNKCTPSSTTYDWLKFDYADNSNGFMFCC